MSQCTLWAVNWGIESVTCSVCTRSLWQNTDLNPGTKSRVSTLTSAIPHQVCVHRMWTLKSSGRLKDRYCYLCRWKPALLRRVVKSKAWLNNNRVQFQNAYVRITRITQLRALDGPVCSVKSRTLLLGLPQPTCLKVSEGIPCFLTLGALHWAQGSCVGLELLFWNSQHNKFWRNRVFTFFNASIHWIVALHTFSLETKCKPFFLEALCYLVRF